ncbi:hypothetical protein GCM10020256_62040 [Streptomyces thermocoprophilus]
MKAYAGAPRRDGARGYPREEEKCGGRAGPDRAAGTLRGSAQQEQDHTRPKSMWERVTSH